MMDTNKGKIVLLNPDYDPVVEFKMFRKAGYELIVAQCSTDDEVITTTHDALGIICVYGKITSRVVDKLSACKIIVRSGVGYDMIDVAACLSKGIRVSNIPDYCTEEVADHAVALLLAVQRRLMGHYRNIISGKWVDTLAGPVKRLRLLTLGVIGFGLIGRRFAAKMCEITPNIIACDPFLPDSIFAGTIVKRVGLDEVLMGSDLISLHCPLTNETHHLISEAVIKRMTRQPIIINVSRGGLIDTKALIIGIKSGIISGAGLDVLETEPQVPEELVSLDQVLLTPHTAWYSVEADLEHSTRSVEEVLRVLRGEAQLTPVI